MAKPTPQTNPLTRKAGPLPVWAWVALALAAWFLFLRGHGAASAASGPGSDKGATAQAADQGGGGGGGTDIPQTPFPDQTAPAQTTPQADPLLASVQQTSPSGDGIAPSSLAQADAAQPSYFANGTRSYGVAPAVDVNGNTYVGAYVSPPSPGVTPSAQYALGMDTTEATGLPTPASASSYQAALQYATSTKQAVAV